MLLGQEANSCAALGEKLGVDLVCSFWPNDEFGIPELDSDDLERVFTSEYLYCLKGRPYYLTYASIS